MRKYMTPHWIQASQILPGLKRLDITRLLILDIIAHMVEWIILVLILLLAGEWFLMFWVQSLFSAGWFLLSSYWRQLSNHFRIWCIWPEMVHLDMSVQTPGQKSCVCLIGDLLGASGALKRLSRSVQTLPGLLMHALPLSYVTPPRSFLQTFLSPCIYCPSISICTVPSPGISGVIHASTTHTLATIPESIDPILMLMDLLHLCGRKCCNHPPKSGSDLCRDMPGSSLTSAHLHSFDISLSLVFYYPRTARRHGDKSWICIMPEAFHHRPTLKQVYPCMTLMRVHHANRFAM